MLRAVIDTNVLLSAFYTSLGASYRVLTSAARGEFAMLASPPLFLEYEEVLKRPESQLRLGLPITELDRALDALAGVIEPVDVHILWRPQLRDPDDEMVLETAINGRASHIVTFNTKDFTAARDFGVAVATPKAFWEKVKS
jgi:putative PIN family toxin of toxin-antitoxin system